MRGYTQSCNVLRAGEAICLACEDLAVHTYVTTVRGEAAWVKRTPGITHAGPSVVPNRKAPAEATLEVKIHVGVDDPFWRQVVWWGALPRDLREAALPASNPAAAYGATEDYVSKWPNSGCVEVDSEGWVTVHCMAPQSYREGGRRWARHLHFMSVDDAGVPRPSTVRTVPVWPTHFCDDYRCTHLSSASSHDRCCIVTRAQVDAVLADVATPAARRRYWFVDATASGKDVFDAVARDRYRNVHHERATDDDLRDVGNLIGDDPVVVYCAHRECSAAAHLLERLGRLGLCANVFYMPEGYQPRPDPRNLTARDHHGS